MSDFICAECGHRQTKWSGSCGHCGAWNTLEEKTEAKPASRRSLSAPAEIRPMSEAVDAGPARRTGLAEVDRVLGGGIVPGAILLLSGAPGIGKSTLLLQLAASMSQSGRVLYVSGEETAPQVASRAKRLGLKLAMDLVSETDTGAILASLEQDPPELLIVDSVQTLAHRDLPGSPGSIQQVRESTELLRTACKRLGITVILVGHVTKDGAIAGPKMLEHMVDVVVAIEGDARSGLRLVTCSKNRFGPTTQLGVLELDGTGMHDVADPALRFLEHRETAEAGVALGAALDGERLYIAEIQALVSPSRLAMPRRVISGLDPRRVELLIAILDRHAKVKISGADVFVSLVGGLRIKDPGLDLAIALALASSVLGKPVPRGTVAAGELSLTGEVRPPVQAARRRDDLARLGFNAVLIPHGKERLTIREVIEQAFS